MEEATPSGQQAAAAGSTNGRGAFYSRFLVTVIIDRARALPKRLTDVHAADTFEQLCLSLLQDDLGAEVRPTSLKAFFHMEDDWVLVENNAEPIQAVLSRFPESRSLRFEAFTNELSALDLKPLRKQPKRNLFLTATIFVVKTVLAYEVLASVADVALRAVGLKPNKRDDDDDEQSTFDDVLRALNRMDSEELDNLNRRAKQELARSTETPQSRARRVRSTLQSRLGPAPPPEDRVGARPSATTTAPPPTTTPTPDTPEVPSGSNLEGSQEGTMRDGASASGPAAGAGVGMVGRPAAAGVAAGGARAQLRQKLAGPGAEEALQDIIDAGATPRRKGLGLGRD